MTTISVFGASQPPGTFSVFTDNLPSITPGGRFYRYGGLLPDATIVGGRVWLPAAAPGSTQVKIMLWLTGEINTTPDREVIVNLGATPGWTDGLFSTPAAMPADGIPFRIAYQFVGNPATYVYANNFRTDATNLPVHPQFNGITYSEAQSIFRDGSGPESTPGSFNIYYGVDVLVDDGTTPAEPNDPPTANAGVDQNGTTGTQVTLTGSGTDGDGSIIGYSWVQIGGPAVTLAGSGLSRTFTPTTAGSRTFRLTVTDDDGSIGQDTVTVVTTAPDLPPDPDPEPEPEAPTPTTIQAFAMIEVAVMQLVTALMPEAADFVGGDLSYDGTDDFYIWIGLVPGSAASDANFGSWAVDIDVFDSTYFQAMKRALDLEAMLLKPGGKITESMRIDRVTQNEGPSERPWDDDESAYRVGATYVFTARRQAVSVIDI